MRRFGYLLITYYCVKKHTSQWAFKQINASTNNVLLSVFSFSIFMRTNHRSNEIILCVCVCAVSRHKIQKMKIAYHKFPIRHFVNWWLAVQNNTLSLPVFVPINIRTRTFNKMEISMPRVSFTITTTSC